MYRVRFQQWGVKKNMNGKQMATIPYNASEAAFEMTVGCQAVAVKGISSCVQGHHDGSTDRTCSGRSQTVQKSTASAPYHYQAASPNEPLHARKAPLPIKVIYEVLNGA